MRSFFTAKAKQAREARAAVLYAAVVGRSREPAFFVELGVPDTLDGRFEMTALHAFLVLHRLKAEGEAGAELGQALFDRMFADMDVNLREMGVGDLSVGRQVKAMAKAFYGRVRAYEDGLAAADDAVLSEALRRNLYGTVDGIRPQPLLRMVAYLRRETNALAGQSLGAIEAGEIRFGPLP